MACPRLVIGATGSGVGKTSVTLALVRALARRGLRVQTFKVGPDFLDPTHLGLAAGRPCYNLDGWMCGEAYVRDLFRRQTRDADVAVIEGVMGLFDGAAPDTSTGSTAELARWLEAPVLLVVGAQGVARSLAATVQGFARFEPDLMLAGVLANQCGSDRQADWLAAALASAGLPPLLGAIPRGAFPALPSRHLGLVSAEPGALSTATLDALADALERRVRLDDLLAQLRRSAPGAPAADHPVAEPGAPPAEPVVIGIARDRAFHFYYPDNLEALTAQGARLVPFSPLTAGRLPEPLDALYLGGGYPEEHAAALAANAVLRTAVRRFAAAGGVVYAECGGLMYLSQGIETQDGGRHPMAGVLPFWTRMGPKRKALGYVTITLTADTLWGRRGDVLRGHEFHYSEIAGAADPARWPTAYELRYQRQAAAAPEGFQRDGVLASYAHLHFASRPAAVRHFLEWVRARRPRAGACGRHGTAHGKEVKP